LQPSQQIYAAVPDGSRLRQGELLTDLVQFTLDLATIGQEQPGFFRTTHPFAIIVSQDCDLEQDFHLRTQDKASVKRLPSVLFTQAFAAAELRPTVGGSDIWKRVVQNKDERYHYLQMVEPTCDSQKAGLPALVADFKRYFTLPTEEVYHKLEIGEVKRRCVLTSPYLEHVAIRFGFFLSRVALPQEHAH
jgi:hypothetical protein